MNNSPQKEDLINEKVSKNVSVKIDRKEVSVLRFFLAFLVPLADIIIAIFYLKNWWFVLWIILINILCLLLLFIPII